jgi:hypothetical protein
MFYDENDKAYITRKRLLELEGHEATVKRAQKVVKSVMDDYNGTKAYPDEN